MDDVHLDQAILFDQAIEGFLEQLASEQPVSPQSLFERFPERRGEIEVILRELASDGAGRFSSALYPSDALPPPPMNLDDFRAPEAVSLQGDTKPGAILKTPVGGTSSPSGPASGQSSVATGVNSSDHPRNHSVELSEVLPRDFGDYELLEVIDSGGMGIVYKARSRAMAQRLVAIKIIKPEIGGREALARFALECQSLALMHHPSIATVFEGGATETGDPFLAMELVEGQSLSRYCSNANVPLRAKLILFAKICAGIQHAHRKGIIHRDLKPSNILVTEVDGVPVPKIIDFGLAKVDGEANLAISSHTQLGQILGTLHYMSPEAASLLPEAVDTRSDVFSLGVVLFELLTGTTPLEDQLTSELPIDERLRLVRAQQPKRPSERLRQRIAKHESSENISVSPDITMSEWRDLRGDLDAICFKALQTDPDERYDSVAALASDVQCYLSGNPVSAVAASNVYLLTKLAYRYRHALMAAATIAGLLLLATGISINMAWRARAAEQLSATRLQESLAAQESEALALQRAERERETAFAVNDFLRLDLLAHGSPLVQANRDVTLREVLDQAASTLHDRFMDQPVIKSELFATVGIVYADLGEYETAHGFLLDAYSLCMELFNPDERRVIQIRQGLAENYMHLRQYAEAERLLRLNLDAVESCADGKPSDLSAVQIALASVLGCTGRNDQQRTILKSLIDQPTEDGVSSTAAICNLGVSLMDELNYREALPLLQLSHSQAIEEYGPDDEKTLAIGANLAMALAHNGQSGEAIRILEESILVHASRFGNASPRTLRQRCYLAETLHTNGRLEQAESVARELLDDCERFGVSVAPFSLSIRETYARILFKLERDELAHAAITGFVDEFLDKYGVDDWIGRDALTRAADVLNGQDEHNAARQLIATRWRFADEQFTATPKSEEMALVMQWLLAVRGEGDWETLLRATDQLILVLPNESDTWRIHRASLRYQEAFGLGRIGRTEESHRVVRECYATQSQLLGPHHHETLNSQLQMGLAALKLEQFDNAEQILRSLIETNEEVYDAGNGRGMSAIRGLNKIADHHRDEKNYQAALELYQLMAEFCDEKLGPSHPETLANRNGQGQSLMALEDFASAVDVFEKAAELALEPTEFNRSKYCPLLYNWALSLEDREQWDGAANLWSQTASELRKQFGPTSYRADRADLHLAEALVELGETEKAKLVLSELCSFDADTSARNIVERIEAIDRLCDLVDATELEPLAERLEDLFRQVENYPHMDIWSRTKLAIAAAGIYRRMPPDNVRLSKALELNEQALAMRLAEDATHYRTANAYRALGDAHLAMADTEAAEVAWKTAYETYMLEPRETDSRKRICNKTVQRLADFYENQGQKEMAEVWRQKIEPEERKN